MKLNLGCGFKRLDGWINVDRETSLNPDQVVDLEVFPWPWPDSSANEIMLSHVLEHLGHAPGVFIQVMKELWRICKPGAKVHVHVPDPRNDNFLGDPTHVRPVTFDTLLLFSQEFNRETTALGYAHTPLGIMHGIDFYVMEHVMVFDRPWRTRLDKHEINIEQAREAASMYLNVIEQHKFIIVAVKETK